MLCASGLRSCQNTISSNPHSSSLMWFPFFVTHLMQFPTQFFLYLKDPDNLDKTDSSQCLSRITKQHFSYSCIIIISQTWLNKPNHYLSHSYSFTVQKCIYIPSLYTFIECLVFPRRILMENALFSLWFEIWTVHQNLQLHKQKQRDFSFFHSTYIYCVQYSTAVTV